MNLRVLTLDIYDAIGYKPELISSLQRLELLTLRQLLGVSLPTAYGLLTIPDLQRLWVAKREGWGTAPRLHNGLSIALRPQVHHRVYP